MPLFGPNIDKMKKNHDINGLITELRNNEPAVSVQAAEALIELGDPVATEALLKEYNNIFRFGSDLDKIEVILTILGRVSRIMILTIISPFDSSPEREQKTWKYEKVNFRNKIPLQLVKPLLNNVITNSSENPVVRWYATITIIERGERTSELQKYLIDNLNAISKPNQGIHEETTRALSYFPDDPNVVNLLISIQKGEIFKGIFDIKSESGAIYALSAIGKPLAREYLEYLVTRGDKFFQKRAQVALKMFGTASYDEIKKQVEKEVID